MVFECGAGVLDLSEEGSLKTVFGVFRLPFRILYFLPAQAFRRLPRAGKGLFILGLRSGFCVRKQAMQGANRSKVEHLARIGNAAEAVLWRKSRRNTKYK